MQKIMNKKFKVFFVITSEVTINAFLLNHLKVLSKKYDITVITHCNNPSFLKKQKLDIKIVSLNFSRKINVFIDFFCLIKLLLFFIKHKPHLVHSITPKAGFLGMLAAFSMNIPFRIHTFTGQVWANKNGIKRYFFIFFDYLIARVSTFNLVDSHSQRDFLIQQGVLSKNKSLVFGAGSISGVDLKRFKPSRYYYNMIRKELLIPRTAFVFIYLGRLNQEKGLLDLAEAFAKINSKKSFLIFVGPDEKDFVGRIKEINSHKAEQIKFVNFTNIPEKYLAGSNVLVLPSYREGFGNVIIEAAAVGLPAIASKIYGISDAIIHNKTGLLHPVKNVNVIYEEMQYFLNNPHIAKKIGKAARSRVHNEFNAHRITKFWTQFYSHILKK